MLSTTGMSSSSARPCRTPSIVGVRESTDPLIILLYWERLHPGKRWGTLSWLPCRFSVSCEVTSGSLPSPCSHFFAITIVQKESFPVKPTCGKTTVSKQYKGDAFSWQQPKDHKRIHALWSFGCCCFTGLLFSRGSKLLSQIVRGHSSHGG